MFYITLVFHKFLLLLHVCFIIILDISLFELTKNTFKLLSTKNRINIVSQKLTSYVIHHVLTQIYQTK